MKKEFLLYLGEVWGSIPQYVYVSFLSVFFMGVVLLFALKRQKAYRKIAILSLVEYGLLICCSTIFFRAVNAVRGYDYHPFWSYERQELFVENVMNVVVFVPVGLLLGASFVGLKWKNAILISACFSFSIEMLQFVFKRGFSEIDDVIHNTLGCAIGFGLYKTVRLFILCQGTGP